MTKTVGETSDGYHTFNELYEHRHWLFLNLMKENRTAAWASQRHADGSRIEGWFVAGMRLSDGQQISYHLPNRLWPAVERLGIVTLCPPEWDGHTSEDVVVRLQREFWQP